MSTARYHYRGWQSEWVTKKDCYDASLMHRLGVHGTRKQILASLSNCACGWITTGGNGHIHHIRIYSLDKLRSIFSE